MGALDTLVRSIKAGKYGRPFYSRLDEALEGLKREKGTPEEFLRELEKQPGVKKAEIEDRGIREAIKARSQAPDAKKPITKEKMEKLLREQASLPPVVEDVASGKHTKYEQWRTPGGENYREIMLKLPEDYLTDPYVSSHFDDTPNILAHIRVQDFKSPEGKKVLLVDEVQSDWHQTGRKQGYKTGYEEGKISTLSKEYDALSQRRKDLLKAAEEMPSGGEAFAKLIDEANDITPKLMGLQSQMDDLRTAKNRGVPDAPFKKNWHELAMKRVLDYAAENGYDTVAITPGAEQAKRYDLSKHIDRINVYLRPDGTYDLDVLTKNGNDFNRAALTETELENNVGKEMAQKIVNKVSDTERRASFNNLDLQVGGEGMKGFYDKILPDYLNTYGKQYGASVRQEPLTYSPSAQRIKQGEADDALLNQLGVETPAVPQVNYHKFDITPQMREAIKTKGQPLYSAMGAEGLAAGTGAATIGADALTGNTEQPVQKPVHFTENPDAMLLEMMQRN